MPHIILPEGYPGIRSLFMYSPAAFCMFNRYVDGLGTWAPDDASVYDAIGKQRADEGYLTKPFLVNQNS